MVLQRASGHLVLLHPRRGTLWFFFNTIYQAYCMLKFICVLVCDKGACTNFKRLGITICGVSRNGIMSC